MLNETASVFRCGFVSFCVISFFTKMKAGGWDEKNDSGNSYHIVWNRNCHWWCWGCFGFLYIHRVGDFTYRSDLCDCRIFKIR